MKNKLASIYSFLSVVLLPIALVYLAVRLIKGKEDKRRFFERFGISLIKRPAQRNLIWFHCASVGEANSIFPIIEEIEKQKKTFNFLITTGTVSSAKTINRKIENKKNLIHQYIPIDSYIFVKLFLLKWKPNLAIYIESELWPNLINETAKSNCPVILVNAKISDKSYNRWQKFKSLINSIALSVSQVIAQSEDDKDKFLALGFQNVALLDSLKYAAKKLANNATEFGKLVSQIKDRKVFLSASTSDNEEEIILSAYQNLQNQIPNLLFVIAPRHPERLNEIINLCNAKNLSFAVRSKNEIITPKTQIYISDTLGELGVLYRTCGTIFIGGSLNDRGGQNPIEPANLNCAIISGNKVKNFKAVYSEFKDKNAVKIIYGQEDLEQEILLLLLDKNQRKIISANAKELVDSKNCVIEKYIALINPYLNALLK